MHGRALYHIAISDTQPLLHTLLMINETSARTVNSQLAVIYQLFTLACIMQEESCMQIATMNGTVLKVWYRELVDIAGS